MPWFDLRFDNASDRFPHWTLVLCLSGEDAALHCCSDVILLFELHGHSAVLHSMVRSLPCRCHRVSQRQSYSDDDYSEGDELDQILWPFPVGISITEETRGTNAQRVLGFHVYSTPFTNEMT